MSTPVQVVSIEATPSDAARLMLDRHVRRLPIVTRDKLVGIVTLDDLIADRAVDPELLAQLVQAQLAEPARLMFAGQRGPGAPAHASDSLRGRGRRRRRPSRVRGSGSGIAGQLREEVASAFRRITGG